MTPQLTDILARLLSGVLWLLFGYLILREWREARRKRRETPFIAGSGPDLEESEIERARRARKGNS